VFVHTFLTQRTFMPLQPSKQYPEWQHVSSPKFGLQFGWFSLQGMLEHELQQS
jgi:hypothetical protein